MKLLGSLTSPYVRKVRIVLAEKKIDCEFHIDLPSVPGSSVPGHNPLARIPVLVLDDDSAVYDSRVIVEYLDNIAPNNKLLPAPNRERTEVKRLEALADGILDAAIAVVLERRRDPAQQNPAWIERNLQVVDRSLEALSEWLGERPYCFATHFSLADVAVGCVLGYLSFRFPALPWAETHPNLRQLHERLLQRPAFADTRPRDA